MSFGSEGNYPFLSGHLLKKCKLAYPDSNIFNYTSNNLSCEYTSYAQKYPRGYGYFYFKPIIINEMIEKLPDESILVYMEGRVHFRDKKISWLDEFIYGTKSSDYDILVFQDHTLPESQWSCGDILNDFQVYENLNVLSSGQIGTPYVIRVNSRTRNLVSNWLDYMSKNLEKCRDEISFVPNKRDFIENRYDQSVMSLLIKTDLNINYKTLDYSLLNKKNSLYTNYKSHPTSKRVELWNFIKINSNPKTIYKIIYLRNQFLKIFNMKKSTKFYWEK